ncbi:type I restriction enzyme, S subunit [Acinetobacter junii]|uniref:restriction endonuclease subunit S n=1 Tax=Acinetobacter junii TaxID=40215 RepID=UPI00191E1355|nr:restriction endonuclease subunit S [Acinetobacter junii]QQV65312.1 type I restriction enzyme, S subunit [Acinetobacter junii]
MSQLPRYESYKDSGVQWLGEIPSHWKATRIKFLGDIVLGLTYSPEDVTTGESGTLVLRSSNVQNGVLTLGDNVYVEKVIPKKMVTTDQDILICSRNGSRALIGKCALIEGEGVGQAFGAFMTVLRSPYRKYLYYVLSSDLFKFQIGSFLTSTINQLTTYALGNFEIAFPPLEEQKVITDYLDKRLAQVDALIAKQETLLEKLAEQRVALISHAVTKGLNPDVEMKESGDVFFRKVPNHWKVLALHYIVRLVSGDSITALDFVADGDYPVYGGNGFRGYIDRYTHQGDYVLIGRQGALCGNINFATGSFFATEHAVVVNPLVDINFKWLGFLLMAMNLNQYSTTAAQPGISAEVIGRLKILLPDVKEQNQIAEYIENVLLNIGEFENKVILLKSKLKEYRSTLITQVVTGKIDVRNLKVN